MPRKKKTEPVKLSDPRTRIASTANADKAKTHKMTSSSGGKIDVKKKTVEDAKAGRGEYKPSTPYKGTAVKNKDGKMSGYTTQDGKFTRTSDPVSRKKGAKALAYDKKLHESRSKTKDERSASVAKAKPKGN